MASLAVGIAVLLLLPPDWRWSRRFLIAWVVTVALYLAAAAVNRLAHRHGLDPPSCHRAGRRPLRHPDRHAAAALASLAAILSEIGASDKNRAASGPGRCDDRAVMAVRDTSLRCTRARTIIRPRRKVLISATTSPTTGTSSTSRAVRHRHDLQALTFGPAGAFGGRRQPTASSRSFSTRPFVALTSTLPPARYNRALPSMSDCVPGSRFPDFPAAASGPAGVSVLARKFDGAGHPAAGGRQRACLRSRVPRPECRPIWCCC